MLINDDLSRPALVHAGQMEWTSSPAPGVDRRMLYRQGVEQARATSIVRYAPASRFAAHAHPGGEEFLVLEGTFQDQWGDYPAGTYVRNPPGTAHAPASVQGCTIFVRLWQFAQGDTMRVVDRGNAPASVRKIFEGDGELVTIENWRAQACLDLPNPQGMELLVLSGGFATGEASLSRWSWMRLPAGHGLKANVGETGAQVWIRRAPLLHPRAVPFGVGGR